MTRRIISLLLCVVLIAGFCACGGKGNLQELIPDAPTIELSAADFVDGSHQRRDEYLAAFKTKGMALDGVSINFAADVFDEVSSPKSAETIVRIYYNMKALNPETASDVTVYVARKTTTDSPVLLGNRLYISCGDVESGAFRPYLAGAVYGIKEQWKRMGLALLANGEKGETVLASELESYIQEREGTGILSLHPCYFVEEFTDEPTRKLAMECSRALSEFIICEYGFEAFVSDSGGNFRARWLESMGLDYDVSFLDSGAALLLDSMEFSELGNVDMLLATEDFRLEVNRVDWLADAETAYWCLLDFSEQLLGFYTRLKDEAPEYYAWLKEDSSKAVVKFRDRNYPTGSHASILKAEAIITRGEDILHELCHALKRRSMNDENRWLCEGLTTYLTAPFIPYSAAPYWVDMVALDTAADGATEMERYFLDLTEYWFEKVNGCDISAVYNMEQPIYLIQQAMGYAAFFNPEIESLRAATKSINEQFEIKKYYPANELSYFESMLFVDWLVEKYGLDTVIFAEMDADCYLELFPNAAAFEAEFAEFWKDCIVPLAE